MDKSLINRINFCFVGIALGLIAIYFFMISKSYTLWSDDYSIAVAYRDGASYVNTVAKYYLEWMGNLSIIFFQSIFIGLLTENNIVFSLVNTCAFLMLVISMYFIASGRIPKRKEDVFYILALTFLLLNGTIGSGEVMFWHTGATGYLWPVAVSLVYIALVSKVQNERNYSFGKKLGICILGFVAALGATEMTFVILLYIAYRKCLSVIENKKFELSYYFFVVGAIINIFSPGNAARLKAVGAPGIIESGFKYFDRPWDGLQSYLANNIEFYVFGILVILYGSYFRNNNKNENMVFIWVGLVGTIIFHQLVVPWLVVGGRVAFVFEVFFLLLIASIAINTEQTTCDKISSLLLKMVISIILVSYSLFEYPTIMWDLNYISAVKQDRLKGLYFKTNQGCEGKVSTYPLRLPSKNQSITDVYSKRKLFISDMGGLSEYDYRNGTYSLYYNLACPAYIEINHIN